MLASSPVLFTVCFYRYKYIWKNTWCCIILVSETKDWRLFELFLFKFCCLRFCLLVLFSSLSSVVYLLRLLLCLHPVSLYNNNYLHKVLLIRLWMCASEGWCVCVSVCVWLFWQIQRRNWTSKEKQIVITKQISTGSEQTVSFCVCGSVFYCSPPTSSLLVAFLHFACDHLHVCRCVVSGLGCCCLSCFSIDILWKNLSCPELLFPFITSCSILLLLCVCIWELHYVCVFELIGFVQPKTYT